MMLRRVATTSASARARLNASVRAASRLTGSQLMANHNRSWLGSYHNCCALTSLWRPSSKHELLRRPFASSSLANKTRLEDIYQRKTPLEHVLLRPGMYIGSVEATKDIMWILSKADKNRMKQQTVEYVPALYKIFDEIIVNAVDNKARDPTMRHLDVTIDPGTKANGFRPWISIYNDGRGIPIKLHRQEKVYIPELVLGHLLTGSNFDDTTARLTGGRHGYGAKLTNIFSQEFIVETGDAASGLRYKQVWTNNMRQRNEPEITTLDASHGEGDFTRVSFSPDLSKFEMAKLTSGMVKVLKKRVYDVAGCLSDVQVTLNGQKVPLSGFESYIRAFQYSTTTRTLDQTELRDVDVDAPNDPSVEYIFSKVNKRWQIGVLPSDVGFVQVSFVNGMSALRGGTHVNYIADQLCRRIADYVNRKHSDLNVSPAQVKTHLALFVNCLIENPTFDSQMKEYMSSKPSTYGSTCILSEKFSKTVIANSQIVERVVEAARTRQRAALMRKVSSSSSSNKSRSTVNVPKLEDANFAGTVNSGECSLILTEGDSAKALAVAGLAVVGRDRFGVFPLRGKLLNVRDATDTQLAKNAEFAHLCTILGLNINETYDCLAKRASLRYGRVILMTDQDHDGSHIKGLVFNLFHTFWPELLKQEPMFLSEFITPIIKVFPKHQRKSKRGAPQASKNFFTLPEYFAWKQQQELDGTMANYSVKYYKGLGTSTSAEGKEYFSDLPRHLVDFRWTDKSNDLLEMVFSKTRSADRKSWLLNQYQPDSFLDTSDGNVTFEDFVNKELIQFSHADNARSLPNVLDGLKTSQRKVLFACFKRKLNHEIKVAQLAGYCSEHTAYHHGEASLHSTIVNMAQDYVGANNVPLLYPSGQFGTRLQGGKDAASPRYIFTLLAPYTRLIFPEEDDPLLNYVNDDGFDVEPTHYLPIVPMLLINGSEGIGTGWSTTIPPHHPVQIIDRLLDLLDLEQSGLAPNYATTTDTERLMPWVKGFRGSIVANGPQSFVTRGIVERVNTSTLRISELPVGKWIEDYKKFLWDLVAHKKIKSFTEHHTERDVRFDISMNRAIVAKLFDDDQQPQQEPADPTAPSTAAAIKLFKLESTLNTSNMHAFGADGKLHKFEQSEELLHVFFTQRLALYRLRKDFLHRKHSRELLKLQNKLRFLREVSNGELELLLTQRLPKDQLVAILKRRKYAPQSALVDPHPHEHEEQQQQLQDEQLQDEQQARGDEFDYLLNTSLMSFTKEHADRLQKELDTKTSKLEAIDATSAVEMWRKELLALKQVLLKDAEYQYTAHPTGAAAKRASASYKAANKFAVQEV